MQRVNQQRAAPRRNVHLLHPGSTPLDVQVPGINTKTKFNIGCLIEDGAAENTD